MQKFSGLYMLCNLSYSPLSSWNWMCVEDPFSQIRSHIPISRPSLSSIKAPIFSKVATSRCHDGVLSGTFFNSRICSITFIKYLKTGDFPLPLGIPILSQTIAGSTHAVFSTCILECDMKIETKIMIPLRTAEGATLSAFPICLQPYKINKILL